ncbi:MAG: glycosyltransferase family 4 protein [Patescibacteria group bacterium]|nr:glycosyltransferase family 4 protein [Patescibacteria group bacterium]
MKIIHLSCVAPPQVGGIGKVAAKEVEFLRQRGIEADLFSAGMPSFPALWRYGNTAVANPWGLKKLIKGYDIVHLHFPFYGTAEVLAILKILGAKQRVVMTLHMDAQVETKRNWILGVNRMFFQPWVVGSADALLCSSLDYIKHSSYKKFVGSARLHELPFGVDEERFTPIDDVLRAECRERFGIPENFKVVSFVGGMDRPHAFKGVDVLLKAFAELPQDTFCLLCGEGELRSGYEKLAHEIGVSERVKFVGRVEEPDLPDVYRAGDVFAFPSTSGAEAFGLVAVEAQACGIPVVASDLPGVRTVVEDKVTGFLSPPGDAQELAAHLRLLLENPGMRDEMGKAARQKVLEKFTWKRHIDGLVEVYTSLKS